MDFQIMTSWLFRDIFLILSKKESICKKLFKTSTENSWEQNGFSKSRNTSLDNKKAAPGGAARKNRKNPALLK